MNQFNLSHLTLIFQNGVFARFFKVIQIIYLESIIWDEIREIPIIMLPSHQIPYRLQIS